MTNAPPQLDWPDATVGYGPPAPPAQTPQSPQIAGWLTPEEARLIEARRAHDAATGFYGPGPGPGFRPERKTAGIAVAAMVFAFLMPIIGLVLGIIGAAKLNADSREKGQDLSIAAIVVSIVAWVAYAALLSG